MPSESLTGGYTQGQLSRYLGGNNLYTGAGQSRWPLGNPFGTTTNMTAQQPATPNLYGSESAYGTPQATSNTTTTQAAYQSPVLQYNPQTGSFGTFSPSGDTFSESEAVYPTPQVPNLPPITPGISPPTTGEYTSSIAHGLLPQAKIDEFTAHMKPPAANTNWSAVQRGVSPEATKELNTQQDDIQRADYYANKTQFGRDASSLSNQLQNQYELAQANDALAGFGNILGQYGNQTSYDLGNQALENRRQGLLLQLLGGTVGLG